MDPLISVVVPAYNCAPYIERTLASVVAQNDPNLELIVIDDGSTDGTGTLVAAFPGVRVRRQSNQGVAAARNQAITMARGEWIAFLDADDAWHPNRLALGRLASLRSPESALVFSDFRLVDRDGACLAPRAITSHYRVFRRFGIGWNQILRPEGQISAGGKTFPFFAGDGFPSLFLGNFIKSSTALARRQVLEHLGGFDTSMSTEEDYDLWLRLAMLHPIAYVDAPLVDIRRRPEQLTSAERTLTVADNAVRVVTRTAQRAAFRLAPDTTRRRLADVNRNLAYVALVSGDHRLARDAIRRAFEHGGRDAAAFAIWAWSYLPGRLSIALGHAWRSRGRLLGRHSRVG